MNNKIIGLVLTVFATATIAMSGAPIIPVDQPNPAPTDETTTTQDQGNQGISTYSLMGTNDN